MSKTFVFNKEEANKLLDQGLSQRTIASTNSNAVSSRTHTIVTVNLIQKSKNEKDKETTLNSTINLVDLAGSEKSHSSNVKKESVSINLSLTMLGIVISSLADNSSGEDKKRHAIPYRESILTKLLMNSLGGNCKTYLLATISPADINYNETIITLRFAEKARKIKCKPFINNDIGYFISL